MGKLLGSTCEDIVIHTVIITRLLDQATGLWRTVVTVEGEALGADGSDIVGYDIQENVSVGPPGPNKWTPSTLESDLTLIATHAKQKLKDMALDRAGLVL